jgi:hypothetical protein
VYAEVRYVNLAKAQVETRGVYLAIESVSQSTRAVDESTYILMRRGYWPGLEVNEPDNIVYNTSAYTYITQRFWEIYYIANVTEVGNYLGPAPNEFKTLADPVAELRRRMNITQYMSWLAINTRMRLGDYIDEVFFTNRRAPTPDAVTPYFGIVCWDVDDVFRDCHRALSYPEPELLYCAESQLDYYIMRSALRDDYLNLLRGRNVSA